jgi:hypothetical protein
MISRRSFVLGGLPLAGAPAAYVAFAGTGVWTAIKRRFENTKCAADCFSEDWLGFEYDRYYHSLFELSRSARLTDVATGPVIRAEIREAFGGDHLHAALDDSLQILSTGRIGDFTLHKLRFDLDCGFPVLGCAAVPAEAPRGLVLLAHGMETTPERCFNVQSPDYMNAIGARLCAAGFAVWCPFLPQAGNQESQNNLAGMLSLKGISYHNAVCSALNRGPWAMRKIKVPELRASRYGMSWGSVIAGNLEAATGALTPTVLSGYFRDEERLLESGWLESRMGQPFVTYLHELPNASEYFFPRLAWLVRPCRIYFEVGDQDGLSNDTFGLDEAFAKVQSAYREINASDAVTMEKFAGGHEVAGAKAIAWLQAQSKRHLHLSLHKA